MKTPTLGVRLAVLAAVISGFSIFVNSYGVRAVPDATLYTTLKNAVPGVLLAVPLFALASRRAELARLSRRDVGWLLALAVIGGSVPYVLFFQGLRMTTATTGSLLNHAQFLVVAALAVPFLRERVSGLAWAGLALLAAGSVAGTDTGALRWNAGAALVVASTVLFGAGVVLARRLLARLSPELVMSAKMSAGAVMLAIYAMATGHLSRVATMTATQWEIVLGTGLILVAFTVATTYSLRFAPALTVTAIGMASAPITLGLQAGAGTAPRLDAAAAWGIVMLVAGAVLFVVAARRRHPEPEPA